MTNNKTISRDNFKLALQENNKKIKEYIDSSNYDIKKYQRYVNTGLDSAFCTIKSNWTTVVGSYIPFVKKSGTMNVSNGLVVIKPKQRVEILITVSHVEVAEKVNINFIVKDRY